MYFKFKIVQQFVKTIWDYLKPIGEIAVIKSVTRSKV